ncbi:MFS transporter [Ornithinimicrobium pratense]|uniref:MFS transporter n=1 Tax=Ornithinimicrobium pratense TaxID=2593973 RepID=A0A5J6V823_9MICO|nr:MFS transporter [Ornithinimicrobium pratense]QFG69266.1 MFS transporter [Ornithinimicrobium pratense]
MASAPDPGPAPDHEPGGRGARHTVALWLVVLAVVLISLNLRPGASSVGPVLDEVRQGLGMSSTTAGLLTALPGFAFGAIGALAVGLSRRVGMTMGICLGLVAIVAGLLLRVTSGSTVVFLLLSTVALAGMAIGNVLVPAWVKRHSKDGGVRLMSLYGAGLILGGAVGSALAAPLTAAPGGWRTALGAYGLLASLALLPWVVLARRELRASRGQPPQFFPPNARLTGSPTALALTLLFGVQSMNAYVQFGWLPQIYRDAGLSAVHAGALLSLLTLLGVIGGLTMPTVIDRATTLAPHITIMGALLVGGYAGLLVAPATLPWLWASMLGLSGFAFPMAIGLITARTRDPNVTAQLSGFVQPVGYVLAGLGPLVVGAIYGVAGDWTLVLALLMASGVVMVLAGLRVARHVYVDDELAR